MASKFLSLGLRGFGFLLALITTALLGNVVASNRDASSSAEAAVNFSLFVAIWAWLALIVGLAGSFVSALSGSIVLLVIDGLAVFFTLIDGIVLAAKLRAVNCSHTSGHSASWIAYGSSDTEKRCRELQASTVFMWFLFAIFLPVLVFSVLEARSGFGGSRRSTGPSMSQV